VIYTPCPRCPMTQHYPCGKLFVPLGGSNSGDIHTMSPTSYDSTLSMRETLRTALWQ
jgi:hypothetical protein